MQLLQVTYLDDVRVFQQLFKMHVLEAESRQLQQQAYRLAKAANRGRAGRQEGKASGTHTCYFTCLCKHQPEMPWTGRHIAYTTTAPASRSIQLLLTQAEEGG
jgi:hypothetical protein